MMVTRNLSGRARKIRSEGVRPGPAEESILCRQRRLRSMVEEEGGVTCK
jgi:hypothetical protein